MPDISSLIVPALLGIPLAAGLITYARLGTPYHERVILAAGLFIAASIYVGFALSRSNIPWVAVEAGGVAVFSFFILMAWNGSAVWLGLGWLLHPAWDAGLHWMLDAPPVAPHWYVAMCIVFDGIVGGYILMNLKRFTEK